MISIISRRQFGATVGASALLPVALRAADYIDLDWSDLLPEGEAVIPPGLQALMGHDKTAIASAQPASSGVRTDWNGMTVRIPGFVVPLDFSGTGVTAFILVPFVGACVHVPPPPANQLVFVTTEIPFESRGLFEPVNVTGMFGTASTRTQLADIGYAMAAERIESFRS